MRYLPILAIAGLLAVGASAQPQYSPYGDRYDGRSDYNRNRGDTFARLRADLERAEANSYWNGGDRHRFNKVREELGEFQRSGNRHELNDTISALQRVVNDNRLAYRDRDVLAQDLYQLRDFRARNGWR
jgi:hypothetical protein